MGKSLWRKFYRSVLLMLLFVLVYTIIPAGTQEVKAAAYGFKTVKKKTYFYNEDGKKHKGWLEHEGKTYYFDKKTGVMEVGLEKIGKYYYFFNKKTGVRYQNGFKKIKNKKYYFSPKNGRAYTGLCKIDGRRYCFDSKGVMQTGLQYVKGHYYFFLKKNGYAYQGGFKKVSGKRYYFDKSTGKAATGWQTINDTLYYFDSKGVMYVDKTVSIDGKTYSFAKNGEAELQKYTISGNHVKVYDEKHDRTYLMVKEYVKHPGIANGELSDRDLLAAICDAEANDQGVVGMMGVAMCILNRTIKSDKEFPSSVREVVYHAIPYSSYPQYSPVRNGALLKRLNGHFEEKKKAYKAVDKALKMFEEYVTNGTPRYIKQYKRADFNFMYFMTPGAFYNQPLNFSRVDCYTYKGHTFFVDWV